MSFPTCHATGLPIPDWGNYRQRAVELSVTRREQEPNGDAYTWTELAALFCSLACVSAFTENGDAEPTPRSTLAQRGLPCVVAADPAAWGRAVEEPF